MKTNAIVRLAEAVGYPERVPEDAVSFVFSVDDRPIRSRISGGRLVLQWDFPEDVPVEVLAGFAAGRILREEAVLAWDPAMERAILWQGVSSGATAVELARAFQAFLNSRDWWEERTRELLAPKAKLADLIINP